ncbi:MAG: alpha/beta family hydrolase [Candidatus Acidiferrales bacterium]
MADVFHRAFFLNGPAGKLEALLWTSPLDDPPFVAVVCHPHPLFAGTMHNKVVYQVAKTLHRRGMPVLRFNFRGAGLSEGEHAGGFGERGDVQAAIDFLANEFLSRPVVLAGFSFGSWVGLRVGCKDARVEKLIGLGVPVDKSNLEYLFDCTKPKLIVQGGNDEFGSRTNIEALFAQMPEPKKLVIIEAVDHFFAGKLPEVGTAIDSWLDS